MSLFERLNMKKQLMILGLAIATIFTGGMASAQSTGVEKSTALVHKFFAEDDWRYKYNEEKGTFTGGIGGLDGKIKNVDFTVWARKDGVIVYHTLEINASEDVRVQMAEFVARANYGLPYGCFETDMRDGEVRYKYHISLAEMNADLHASMKEAMTLGAQMIERYSEGILAVMFGMKSPKQAVDDCEK